VATELSERCGLADLVSFREGGVTALPFADESFDAAILVHVGMNVWTRGRCAARRTGCFAPAAGSRSTT